MKILLRAALGLTAGLLALGAGTGAPNTAHADGPNTDPAVVEAIRQQPWVDLGPGDRNYRIASMGCLLDHLGFYNNRCNPTPSGETWPRDFSQAVRNYQQARFLPQTGRLDSDTWGELQDDNRVVEEPARGDHVRSVQYAMKVLQDSSLNVDGIYGPITTRVVRAFQERKQIDADGDFGPITFRAAFAQGAETRRTPGR